MSYSLNFLKGGFIACMGGHRASQKGYGLMFCIPGGTDKESGTGATS